MSTLWKPHPLHLLRLFRLLRLLREPWAWGSAVLLLLAAVMPHAGPPFAALFPELDRPVYQQDSFLALLGAHAALVAASSVVAQPWDAPPAGS